MRFAWLLVLALGCNAPAREVDDVLAAYRKTERYIEAPRDVVPEPWRIGQWTLYKIASTGKFGYIKHSVVGEARCGYWFETMMVLGRYDDRTVFKVCLREPPDDAVAFAEQAALLGAYVSRRGERVVARDFGEGRNPEDKEVVVQQLEGLVQFAQRGVTAEGRFEIAVPAAQFAGVVRIPARMWIESSPRAANLWYHPVVPLGGVVKANAYNDDEKVILELELLDYGDTGAATDLPSFAQALELESS